MGCPKAQTLSRTVIEFIHNLLEFSVGDASQTPVLRGVLPYQIVGIFIQDSFPGGIRMRKVNPDPKVTGHALMIGKHAVIGIGDRVNLIPMRTKRRGDRTADGWRGLLSNTLTTA